MKLRARFTALFAILAAATIVVLVLVSDAVVGRAVSERVSSVSGASSTISPRGSPARSYRGPRGVSASRRAASSSAG